MWSGDENIIIKKPKARECLLAGLEAQTIPRSLEELIEIGVNSAKDKRNYETW